MKALMKDLQAFSDKEERRYIHLVYGGISDNLGVRSMVNGMMILSRLRKQTETHKVHDIKTPRFFVFILRRLLN